MWLFHVAQASYHMVRGFQDWTIQETKWKLQGFLWLSVRSLRNSVTFAACYWVGQPRFKERGIRSHFLTEEATCMDKNRMVSWRSFWRELPQRWKVRGGRIHPRESVFWIRDTTTYYGLMIMLLFLWGTFTHNFHRLQVQPAARDAQ